MGITSAIVLFAVIWFMVFFIALPIRIETQGDLGKVTPGTHAGSPEHHHLKKKAWITTGIAVVLWIVIAGVIAFGYLWWKTRAMRKQMREQQNARGGAANDVFGDDDFKGEIIEGEVIHKVVCLEEEVKR